MVSTIFLSIHLSGTSLSLFLFLYQMKRFMSDFPTFFVNTYFIIHMSFILWISYFFLSFGQRKFSRLSSCLHSHLSSLFFFSLFFNQTKQLFTCHPCSIIQHYICLVQQGDDVATEQLDYNFRRR